MGRRAPALRRGPGAAGLAGRYTAIEDYLIERGQADSGLPTGPCRWRSDTTELNRINVPVTLICGRHDQLVPIVHTQRVSAELGWPLAVIDDAGHLPHLEQPRLFAAALRSAIDPDHQPTHNQEKQ